MDLITLALAKAYADKLLGGAGGVDVCSMEEIFEMLALEGMLSAVLDGDGMVLSDENNNILIW